MNDLEFTVLRHFTLLVSSVLDMMGNLRMIIYEYEYQFETLIMIFSLESFSLSKGYSLAMYAECIVANLRIQ